VLVVGPPGVGKSWVARRVAHAYRLPHVELDGFKLKPWRQLAPPEEAAASLKAAMSESRWLLDGNWTDDEEAAAAWQQADLVVWLDYPRWLVMIQVTSRSVRRLITREVYYGWEARLRDWLSPTHPVRWS